MKLNTQLSLLASAVTIGLVSMTSASAAPGGSNVPKQGTEITNYATATYKIEGQTETIETQSNTVKVTVGEAPSFTLIQDNNTNINKKTGEVTFKHTIKNTGNANDTYNLTTDQLTNDNFDYDSVTIYPADEQGNRISGEPAITSIDIEAGKSKNFVVVAEIDPSKLKDKEIGKITVTAESQANSKTETNTDKATVSISNLLIKKIAAITTDNAQKDFANVNDIITYTITYSNTGSAAVDDVLIVDKLPSNVEYEAGSAKFDNNAVTDAADGDQFVYDSASKTIRFKAGTIAANTTDAGTLTFKVKVVDESNDITNIASIGEDTDNDGNIDNTDSPSDDATVQNGTTATKGTINETKTDPYADAQTVPTDPNKDNKIVKEVIITNTTSSNATSAVNNGQLAEETVTFQTYVHNTGNTAVDFDVKVDGAVPGELKDVTITPDASGSAGDATTTATTGELDPGKAKLVTVTATVRKGAKLKDDTDYTIVLETSPKGSNDTDNIKLIVNAQKALEIIKKQAKVTPSAGQTCGQIDAATLTYSDVAIGEAKIGDCIFYEITATNYYPKKLVEVVLSDTLEQNVLDYTADVPQALSSTKGNASFASPTVSTTQFELNPNEKAKLHFGRVINK